MNQVINSILLKEYSNKEKGIRKMISKSNITNKILKKTREELNK